MSKQLEMSINIGLPDQVPINTARILLPGSPIPIPEKYLPRFLGPVRVLDLGCGIQVSPPLRFLTEKNVGLHGPKIISATCVDFFQDNLERRKKYTASQREIYEDFKKYGVKPPIEMSLSEEVLVQADAVDLERFGNNSFDCVMHSMLTKDNPYFFDSQTNLEKLSTAIDTVLRPGGYYIAYHEISNLIVPPGYQTIVEVKAKNAAGERYYTSGLIYGIYQKPHDL